MLQAGLLREGCYPGEEEMEDWIFGDQTQSALMTFQVIPYGLRSGRPTSSAGIKRPGRRRALFWDTSGITCCPACAGAFTTSACNTN